MTNIFKDSLPYHSKGKPGKLEITPTKPLNTQEDLSLAYSPGVAGPCEEISKDPDKIFEYTFKSNMVAVITDGSAVLGMGDIGPEASLPVMEGKSALMKKFADIDSFPLILSDVRDNYGKTDIKKFCNAVTSVHKTFGGINLEDIASPACFEIEKKLENELNIPVFHDDQHGTAIISLAGLINSLKLTNKKIENIKVVINGAGAAGIATAKYYIQAGLKKKNLLLCDSKGVIHKERPDELNQYKLPFVISTNARTLKDALVGADVFVGVSVANILSREDIQTMSNNPIVFAMSNPVPEIMPDEAIYGGAFIVATGRSDFPNQTNNVLGFPGIFRGALDTRSTKINVEMKIAASNALAQLANEKVPNNIKMILEKAYPNDFKKGVFNGDCPLKSNYIIPKPFDPRVVPKVARFVAEAAMKSNVAKVQIEDLDKYEKDLLEKFL